MDNPFNKGHASESTGIETSRSWYITPPHPHPPPHHGVYHPHKPDKIWVLFDCSSEFQERSLNKELLSAPDLTKQIVGVL